MSLCFGSPGYEGVGFARASPNITVGVGERGHLQRILAEDFEYYNTARPPQSLDRNSPVPREVEPPANGRVVATPSLAPSIIGTAAPPDERAFTNAREAAQVCAHRPGKR